MLYDFQKGGGSWEFKHVVEANTWHWDYRSRLAGPRHGRKRGIHLRTFAQYSSYSRAKLCRKVGSS